MKSCIFCKISAKEIPAEMIYENDDLVVFNDINPKAPVHILIVTKEHIANVDELGNDDKNLISKMILIAQKIAREKGVAESGYRLVFNVKSHGGQEVEHIHLHLLGGKQLGSMV